jgi:5'-deoxynucleotidase YfbR-like HD superfamily hydrolase
MTQQEFQACIDKCQYEIEEIREHAHMLHDSVNQRYDMNHPYSYHLDMVADLVFKYGHLVCQQEGDVLPLFFGAFYHDSIEDARMTYNDVTKGARLFMSDDQAYMAAEMVYALTNEKGRTRAERANDRYYAGIRETPYAPFLKLADRLANITYSCSKENGLNGRMRVVYKDELPHFLEAINAHSDDPRFALPQVMIDQIYQLL